MEIFNYEGKNSERQRLFFIRETLATVHFQFIYPFYRKFTLNEITQNGFKNTETCVKKKVN